MLEELLQKTILLKQTLEACPFNSSKAKISTGAWDNYNCSTLQIKQTTVLFPAENCMWTLVTEEWEDSTSASHYAQCHGQHNCSFHLNFVFPRISKAKIDNGDARTDYRWFFVCEMVRFFPVNPKPVLKYED